MGADSGLYAALSAAFVFCPADGWRVCQDGVWHAECHFYLYSINIWRYFYLQISPFSCNFAFAKLKSLSLTPPSPGGVFPFAQMPPPNPGNLSRCNREGGALPFAQRGATLLPKGVRTFCLKGCDPFAQRGTDLLPKGVRPFCLKGYDPFAQRGATLLPKRGATLLPKGVWYLMPSAIYRVTINSLGCPASNRASPPEEAVRPCKYRAKEKKRRENWLNIFNMYVRGMGDFRVPRNLCCVLSEMFGC